MESKKLKNQHLQLLIVRNTFLVTFLYKSLLIDKLSERKKHLVQKLKKRTETFYYFVSQQQNE